VTDVFIVKLTYSSFVQHLWHTFKIV